MRRFTVSKCRWLRLVPLLLAALGTGRSAAGQSFLRAEGPRIVNTSDQEVLLNGVNLGGWLLQEGYIIKPGWPGIGGKQTQGTVKKTLYNAGLTDAQVETFYQSYRDNFITKPDIDYIASLGFNCLRLPLHYDLFLTSAQRAVRDNVIRGTVSYNDYVLALTNWYQQDQLFTDPAQLEAFRQIDKVLDWAAANQLYVVLDLHAAPGSQGTDANIADALQPLDFWNQPIYQDITNRLWARIARRYKDDARVAMYDLLNEPNNVPDNQRIHDVLQRLINTVRAEGDHHLLLLEGNGYGNDFNYMEKRTFSNTANLVYNSHRYSGPGYSLDNNVNSVDANNANSLRTIGNLTRFRTDNDVPIWVGETGENTDSWMHDAAKALNSVKIGWCHWTYKRFEDGNNAALLHIPSPYIVDGPAALPQVLHNILFANGVPNSTVAAVAPLQNNVVNYPDGGNYNGTTNGSPNGPHTGRVYRISARVGGQVLGIADGSGANGALLQQVNWVGAASQKWVLTATGTNDYVRIVNLNSRKALETVGPSGATGALIQQWDWRDTGNQYWQVLANGFGSYRLRNTFSGKVLEIKSDAPSGTPIVQAEWVSGTNQQWFFSDLGAASGPLAATTAAAAENRLRVYPTVADTELHFYYLAPAAQQLTVRLFDLTGRVVAQQSARAVMAGENHLALPVAALRAGVYLLRAETAAAVLTRRVVVAHD